MLPVQEAKPGDIIVTATGENTRHGHTGYVLDNGEIASNSSQSGKLEKNYTLDSWMYEVAPRNINQTAVFRYVGKQNDIFDSLIQKYNQPESPSLNASVNSQIPSMSGSLSLYNK